MKSFNEYISETSVVDSLVKKLKGDRSVIKAIKKHSNSSNKILAKALLAIPAVSAMMTALSNPDKLNRAALLASTLKRAVLNEAVTERKGWIHKTGKAIISRGEKPYHIQMMVNNLSKFGLQERIVLKQLEKRFDEWDVPDPDQEAKRHLDDLKDGTIDIDRELSMLAMKKGWCRVVFGRYNSIEGMDLKTIHAVGKIIDKKYPETTSGSFELELAQNGASYDILDADQWKQWIRLGGDPTRINRGRTEIGRTMAQFR
tara:strand:- start:1113 stop:1886 length:774 start_codon:yes stop_codon:yes gene_type:complete